MQQHFKVMNINTHTGGNCTSDLMLNVSVNTYEPPRGKTNNVVSEQVRHKPTCTSTEKS